MIERERFESWARQRWTHPEDFDQRIKAPSKYNNYEVQAAWDAWQERAAKPAPSVPDGWKFVPIEPSGSEERMRWLLRQIVSALPSRRDWLDPAIEEEARLAAAPEAKP